MAKNPDLYKSYAVLRYYRLTPYELIEIIDSFDSLGILFKVKEGTDCVRIDLKFSDLYNNIEEINKFKYTPCYIFETDQSGEELDSFINPIKFEYLRNSNYCVLNDDIKLTYRSNKKYILIKEYNIFYFLNPIDLSDKINFDPLKNLNRLENNNCIKELELKESGLLEQIYQTVQLLYRRDLVDNSEFYKRFEKYVEKGIN